MNPFRKLTALAAPLDRTTVDTDQIIPKQFLKRIERTGYGEFLFYGWRKNAAGAHISSRRRWPRRPPLPGTSWTFAAGK